MNSSENCEPTDTDDAAALEAVGDERDFFDRVNPLWAFVALLFILSLV